MTTWILLLMHLLQPSAPWLDTYPTTAAAIDEAAHEAPLYAGEDGPERTAAELVAVAWFESKFDPHAIGDHGRSLGAWQVGVSNVSGLHIAPDDLFDVGKAARAALTMMRLSHRVCAVRPKGERLAHYAAGGPDCSRGVRESLHRTALAARLLREHPVTWSEGPNPKAPPLHL